MLTRKEDHINPNHIDFGCSPHIIAKTLPKDIRPSLERCEAQTAKPPKP